MTTVSQFIEYLKTLPPDMTVKVMEEEMGNWGVSVGWIDLVLPDENGYSPTIDKVSELWLGCR